MEQSAIVTLVAALFVLSLVQTVWIRRVLLRVQTWLVHEKTDLGMERFATWSWWFGLIWLGVFGLATTASFQAGRFVGRNDAGELIGLFIVNVVWSLIQAVISLQSRGLRQQVQRFAATRGLAESGKFDEVAELLPQDMRSLPASREELERHVKNLDRATLFWLGLLLVIAGVAAVGAIVAIFEAVGSGHDLLSLLALGLLVLGPSAFLMVFVRCFTDARAKRTQLLWFLSVATSKGRPLASEMKVWAESHSPPLGQTHWLRNVLFCFSPFFLDWFTRRYNQRVLAVADDLAVGTPLSDALNGRRVLAPHDLLSIRVGEQTGRLPETLRELAVRQTDRLKGDPHSEAAIGTMLYLWVLFTAGINIVAFLMYYIVPKFKAIFLGFGTELPGVTVLLINVSDSLAMPVAAVGPMLSLMLLVTLGEAYAKGWSETRIAWFLGIARRAEVPQLLARLRGAVLAKVPWQTVLRPMVLHHHRPDIRSRLERVLGRVTAGMEVWPALRDSGLLTSRDVGLLEMAERANNLDWALSALADSKERGMAHRWRVIQTFLVPVCVFFGGLFVAFVAIGMFIPLVKLLNDLS